MNEDRNPQLRRLGPGILLLALLVAVLGTVGVAAAADTPAILQSPSPSPTGGQLQLPTATATPAGGPTATVTRTPTLVPVLAETIGDPTNLRTGPGIDFDLVAELPIGTTLPIIGRWLGYDWLLVAWADAPGGEAWIYQPLVIVRGDITTVPAVDPPEAPTVDPTQESIEMTAMVLLQTPGAAETATATAFFLPTGVFTQTPSGEGPLVGALPTFTPPPPFVQPDELAVPQSPHLQQGGLPPATLIIALGAMGVLTLTLGLLRRLF